METNESVFHLLYWTVCFQPDSESNHKRYHHHIHSMLSNTY